MATKRSKQPTKAQPKPVGDARRRAFASIDAALDKYKLEAKTDDIDVIGLIGFMFITKSMRRAFFEEDYNNICQHWEDLTTYSSIVLEDMKQTNKAMKAIERHKRENNRLRSRTLDE